MPLWQLTIIIINSLPQSAILNLEANARKSSLEGVGGGGLVFFCFLHFAFLPLARGAAAFIPAEEEEEEDTRA